MNDAFYDRLQVISVKIEGIFDKKPSSPYIHCSKLNSTYMVLRQIPEILRQIRQTPNKRTTSTAICVNAITSILSIIEQIQNLCQQCNTETCVQFLLATPVASVRLEISQLRDAAASAFDQLQIPQIANLFRITEEELNAQDQVDMKRISLVLLQISNMHRSDAADQLSLRFKSLEKIGIDLNAKDASNIQIPELPSNLHLVIQHEDVEIGNMIGHGQSGDVKRGTMKTTGEVVAVKILHRRSLKPQELESLKREIYVQCSMNHPCILRFIGYTEDSPFYVVTEYMQHGSLFDTLRKHPEDLTPTIRTIIAYDVANGLAFLHARGIIHRDMKSLNILLNESYRAKISDFGMVRKQGQDPKTGQIGTAQWMAPEVLMSAPNYDERVDIYSFGIFLWELLTGEMPYKGIHQAQIPMLVLEKGLRPTIPEDAPKAIAKLITQCWSQLPEDRPPMKKVLADLVRSKFHFVGTDESTFRKVEGIKKHKKHLHKTHDIVPILQALSQNPRDTGHSSKLAACFSNPLQTKQILDSNIIQTILTLPETEEAVSVILKGLANTSNRDIFTVAILKELLKFGDSENPKIFKNAALALAFGAEVQFSIVSSAPSFLPQILNFLRKRSDAQSVVVSIVHKIMMTSNSIKSEVFKQLLRIYSRISSEPELIHSISQPCGRISHLRTGSDSESTSRSDFSEVDEKENDKNIYLTIPELLDLLDQCLVKYLTLSPPTKATFVAIIKGHCEAFIEKMIINLSPIYDKNSNDIISAMKECQSFAVWEKISSDQQYNSIVLKNIPFNADPQLICKVYENLLLSGERSISKIPEFYHASAFLIKSNDLKICQELRRLDIDKAALAGSNLAQTVVDFLLKKNVNQDDLVLLMGVFYKLARTATLAELSPTIPHLFSFVFGDQFPLRTPAFLCCAAFINSEEFSMNYEKNPSFLSNVINVSQIVKAAAYYVTVEIKVVRNEAALTIKLYIQDKGVNLNQSMEIFLENVKEPNEVVKEAMKNFAAACRANPDRVDNGILKRMSEMYSRAH